MQSEDSIGDADSIHYTNASIEAPGWTWSKHVLIITLSTMTAIISLCILIERLFGFPSTFSLKFSTFLGLLALVLSFFQFIPQIVKTYKLQVSNKPLI